ncbi:MAG: hypothetical protein Q8920_12350 [Bacillota bacterium]|nr:hypothetical protein [Bacillota bacterium]
MKVEAYFSNIKTAKEALEKLKSSGFEAFLDINDHYNEDRNVRTNLAGTETSVSLSGLVLESDSDGEGHDRGPLNAASPMASGMGNFEEVADVKCKIVAQANESNVKEIKQILKDLGGDFDSPNVIKPKLTNKEEIEISRVINQNQEFLKRGGGL